MLWSSVTFAKVNGAESFVRLVAATQSYCSAVQGPHLVICRYLPRQPENLGSFTTPFDPHFLVNLYRRRASLSSLPAGSFNHFIKYNVNHAFAILYAVIIKIVNYKAIEIYLCVLGIIKLVSNNSFRR